MRVCVHDVGDIKAFIDGWVVSSVWNLDML